VTHPFSHRKIVMRLTCFFRRKSWIFIFSGAGFVGSASTRRRKCIRPDEQALIIPPVKNRVREFRNTATSDTWFNFPEAFGITANLLYGNVYSLHESLRRSPVETNGFEIFVSSVIIKA